MEKAPGLKCESASRRFQPGEGPSRGLLRDCTTSPINRFAALVLVTRLWSICRWEKRVLIHDWDGGWRYIVSTTTWYFWYLVDRTNSSHFLCFADQVWYLFYGEGVFTRNFETQSGKIITTLWDCKFIAMRDTSGSLENWPLLITRYIVLDPFHPVIHLQSLDRDTTLSTVSGIWWLVFVLHLLPGYLDI